MQMFPPSSRKGRGWVCLAATIAFTSVIASTAVFAQESRAALDRDATLRVLDVNGVPIPNVTVALNGGSTRVSDKAGVVNVKAAPRDSLRVLVRRMGYKAFEGKVGRDSITGSYAVTLTPTSQSLKTVKVEGRQSKSSLDLTGFYDRIQEVQRGAVIGEFFTPEDVEARATPKVTDFLRASRFVQLRYVKPFPNEKESTVIAGRAGCALVVLIDGMQVANMSGEINGKSRSGGALDINELVNMSDIAAIEIYPSIANAPVAIATRVLGNACGVVAIWTGGRR
ncbi:MAG: hypothetical protein ABI852_03170 [Gemmatimonadaceae bacterium]